MNDMSNMNKADIDLVRSTAKGMIRGSLGSLGRELDAVATRMEARRDWPTEVHQQYLEVLSQRDFLSELLEEAMEWIERPVETQEDAAMFLFFEEKVTRVTGYERKT